MSDLIERLREGEVPDWLRAFYSVVYLTTFIHAIITGGAWMCCPPAYGEFATFAHAVQIALGWTGATVATAEVLIPMVLLVPKVYYGIKEKGMREGELKGKAEGRAEGRAEGKLEGKAEGIAEGTAVGMAVGKAEGKAEGKLEGIAEGELRGERAERERIAAALDAAGITDPETRRIVMNGDGP